MADGNLSRIIVWVSDTVILKKQLDGKVFYYVADAVTGQPVAKADLDFFGWKQVQVAPNQPTQYRVETTAASTQAADADGQVILGQDKLPQDYQWLITARKAKDGAGRGRPLRLPGLHRRLVRPAATTPSTTRPRCSPSPIGRSIGPSRRCSSSSGSRHAKYDQPDASDFANQPFTVADPQSQGRKGLREEPDRRRLRRPGRRVRRCPRTPRSASTASRSSTTAAATSASRNTRSPSSK